MQEAFFIVLLLAYGLLRSSMPLSLWFGASDLRHYLYGCLVPPVLDLIAMFAIAHFAAYNFRIREPWLKAFVLVTLLSGFFSFWFDVRPIFDDLQGLKSREAVIDEKLPDQGILLHWDENPKATASLTLPNVGQYQRIPLHFPVQLRVAPELGVAYFTGPLE